jgi:hypothetical protein
MKNSIILLGLVVLSFTNANATTEFETQVLDQQETATVNVENTQDENQMVFASQEVSAEEATETLDPQSVLKTVYAKTAEDRIAEDKLITESKEENVQPLSLGFTTEDRIAEGNQIIESQITNEVFPLDFDKINRSVITIISNNNALKVTELKL